MSQHLKLGFDPVLGRYHKKSENRTGFQTGSQFEISQGITFTDVLYETRLGCRILRNVRTELFKTLIKCVFKFY